jgi:hypothetical protein
MVQGGPDQRRGVRKVQSETLGTAHGRQDIRRPAHERRRDPMPPLRVFNLLPDDLQ